MNCFIKMMKINKLYVVKQNDEVVGEFLLKTEDENYWNNNKKAYYIHHFVTKHCYPNLGTEILNFIENLTK